MRMNRLPIPAESSVARGAWCVAVGCALAAAGITRAQAPSEPKPAPSPSAGSAAPTAPATPAATAVPEPTADPGSTQDQGVPWGVPGANAAQGGVSTPAQATGMKAPASAVPSADVKVSAEGRFTLSAQGIEVSKLLELISIKARQNIVASDKVKGVVTVNLYDVPLEEALSAILAVNGLSWKRDGDFIYVWTKGEVDAQRKREARVLTLQFLSAEDAIAFIKPVLSEGGSAIALGKVEAGYQPTLENGGADSFAFAAKVMVNDYPEIVERAASLVSELDTPPKQVRVEATILTVDLTDDTAFGLDISVVGNIDFANVTGGPMSAFNDMFRGGLKDANGNPVATPTPSTANAASLYPVSQGQPDPTAKIGVMTNDVAVFLQMLDQVTDSTVLARPTVTVLNRQRAQVLIGERIAYLSTTQTQTSTTQEVKYLDVGVKLIFRPFVSPDGMVRIELAPQVSTAKIKNIDAVGGKATVPDELTQELRTNIRVKSGQTIVLGGLFRETSQVTNRQIPGLGDLIPGAFSGASGTMKKQEIIFLITPTVVEDAQDYREGDRALEVAEAAKVGARAGLLPFSESHLAGNYQLQALEAWKKGDRSTALYYVDQALRTQKNSPSMLALREAIRTDRKEGFRQELDSVELLDPLQREPQNGIPLSDTFKYSKGWVAPPGPAELAKDPPPPVDDDYDPFDPLPVPEPPLPVPGTRKEDKP